MRTFYVVTGLFLLLASSGCLAVFPPASLDYGRGARPLERGAVRVQAGASGSGTPFFLAGGGALGGRVEAQLTDHLAVGVDGSAGLQLAPLVLAAPFGGRVSAQLNPGLPWLALRGSLGAGADLLSYPFSDALLPVHPWASASGGLVLSVPRALWDTGAIEPYASLDLGLRRYAGFTRGFAPSLNDVAVYETVYAAGATLGAAWHVMEEVSLYAALSETLVIAEAAPSNRLADWALAPSTSLQAGVSFSF